MRVRALHAARPPARAPHHGLPESCSAACDHHTEGSKGLSANANKMQELRFLHNPDQPHGFCGAALSSNVIHFTKVRGRSTALFEGPPKSEGLVAQGIGQTFFVLSLMPPHLSPLPVTSADHTALWRGTMLAG